MAGAVSCRQSAARGLAAFGLGQRRLCCGTLPRIRGNDCYYYPTGRRSPSPRCRKQRFELCHGRFLRQISRMPWATQSPHVQHQTKRQLGVETRTAAAHSLSLGPGHFPDLERAQISLYSSLHGAYTRGMLPSDVRLQSLICIPDEKVSMQLIVSGWGKEWTALVEVPCSGLIHWQQFVASRIESVPSELEGQVGAEQASVLLLSQLESILDSITTVDGHNADDIVVAHRDSSNFRGWPERELADEVILERLTGRLEGTGVPSADRQLSQTKESPETMASLWDMHEAHLDSFRTLFDSECCRMPYHMGFEHLTMPVSQLGALAAFSGTGKLASMGSQKREPSMEEHLAVLYEKLRMELPNFFLKPHDYGMYSRNIEFISQFPRIKTRGRTTYQAIVTLLRFVAWNYCADIHMEVMKMTQHPEDWTIQVRWRVTGLPLHVLMLRFYKKDKTELYRTYDAYSTFYLGPDGLIHRHKVTKMMPTQPPLAKVKTLLVGALVALGLEEHRPALNLLFAQSAGKVGEKHC
ncbi:uncharacterized protein C6orf136 homolog [Heterodontus francisci]|uniref:uncharacterized protein C6orf136 homolog n=1 Tax=Heterodontus francisci TaxID=7792 RepID=UPI00355C4D32